MAVLLEGRCRVTDMREGAPVVEGTFRSWHQIGKATGAQAISLRLNEFGPGLSPGLRNPECDEVIYLLEALEPSETSAACTVFIDGSAYEVFSQTGLYIRPGQTFAVSNPGPHVALFVSSQCPEPTSSSEIVAPLVATAGPISEGAPPIVRLADRKEVPTADRWYRVLVDDEVGSTQVTQFIGSIPPGRAPVHFHHYEEVLFILRGEGRMWAGNTSTPIAAGSCIYLPKGQVHCVENTGQNELRLLGVFYPAGSPAVRYET
jgi:mannose-6-phosphate isomerase-like protein (cupin superfamily)